jgi:hypothetical protein
MESILLTVSSKLSPLDTEEPEAVKLIVSAESLFLPIQMKSGACGILIKEIYDGYIAQ